jgi:hypothetical protein
LFIQHTKQENQIPNRDTIYLLDGDENGRLRSQNSRLRRRYLDRIENDRDRRYYDREIERVRDDTQRRIRELEQQVQESNQEPINTNGGPDLTESETLETFNNSDNLYLFYTVSCPHSQAILPIWYRIVEALPSSCSPVEKDCSKMETRPTCSAYGITGVPTIILEKTVDGKKIRIEYSGDNTYNDIKKFLKNNDIILSGFENTSNNHLNPEAFNNIETFQNIEEIEREDPNLQLGLSDKSLQNRLVSNQEGMCPDITYDKNLDRSVEKYYFQIFNEFGQHGYSAGGVGEPLDKFHAAYNAVDTYLSSLPDPELMEVCAKKNKKMIREFELCDDKKLNKILSYPDIIDSGKTNPRVSDIDYDNNKNVVNSIKKACSI